MNTVTTFVPGNISCLFVLLPDNDPSQSGSLGVGFTVNKGVNVSVELSENTRSFFNDNEINFPTILSVIRSLTARNATVHISSELPLGSGFGLSGASALATAYALNELLELNKDKLELAKVAHVAEVENGTGMGDVVNEYFGGFLLKTVSSSHFIVQKIPITGMPVYCKYFSKLPTKNILSDSSKFSQINAAGKSALKEVQRLLRCVIPAEAGIQKKEWIPDQVRNDKSLFSKIIQISKEFAEESGLLKDQQVIATIREIESRGGHASMIMLGNAVFSDIPFKDSFELTIC